MARTLQADGMKLRLSHMMFSRGVLSGALVAAVMLVVQPAPRALAQDAAEIVVRMGQIEDQVRTMSGRIEQLQFENRRLNEQLRKFQQDIEFRLQERAGSGAGAPATPAPEAAPGRERRGDASATDAGATTGSVARSGDAFDEAKGQFQQRQYRAAEMGFRQFLQANPRDKRAAEAIYWLGESYFQRQQYSDAAEQFLKISTEYPKSNRGADALVKLSMSLSRLNAKPEACATLSEVLRKYPNASVDVRSAVERERRRTKC